MARTKIFALAALVTFASTGCTKTGAAGFLTGLVVAATIAHVAHSASEPTAYEEERARSVEIDCRAAARPVRAPAGWPEGSLVVIPAACLPE